MQSTALAAICAGLAVALVSASQAEAVKLTPQDAKAWINYTVPLPKSIEITGKVKAQGTNVAIVPPGNSDMVTLQLLKELREAFGLKEEDQPAGKPVFTLKLEIGGPDAEALKPLKNSEQAYRIIAGGDSNELRLVALAPRGLYYAGKTLQQLVAAKAGKDTIEIPILSVTDWPDMDDRGLWGSDNFAHMRWMADRKMNIAEQISNCGMDDVGNAFAKLQTGREPMVNEGPIYGIKPVPVILHLEQVGGNGVFKAHPEYRGIGTPKNTFCYAQPGVVDVIADWMVQLASLPNVTSIDQWLTENMAQQPGCQCDECKKVDRNVLEARVVIRAWEKAKQKLGRYFGLYVLTSEETEYSNRAILAELPKDVRFWYYHSLLTYTATHEPMIDRLAANPKLGPYLQNAAAAGRWVGVCPNINAVIGFYEPFTGPQFIHARMNEFVDKGLLGLLGYSTPRVHWNQFNTEAAAEWSWNAKGRTPHEFTYTWAIRQGLKNPELFAEWTDVLAPVAWDVYGSAWPDGEQRKVPEEVALRLKKGTLDELGFILWDSYGTPWGDIKTVKQLDDDVAAAERGLELARKLGIKEYWYESLVVDGYIKSLKALYELKQIVKPGMIAADKKDEAKRYFEMYITSLRQTQSALPEWEKQVDRGEGKSFTKKTVDFISGMIDQMKQTAKELGVTVKAD